MAWCLRKMRTILHFAAFVFCDVSQRMLVVYRRFGIAYRSHLQGSSKPCLTRANNYKHTQRDVPDERTVRLHRSRSLESRIYALSLFPTQFAQYICFMRNRFFLQVK
jgi:hypothetical protein